VTFNRNSAGGSAILMASRIENSLIFLSNLKISNSFSKNTLISISSSKNITMSNLDFKENIGRLMELSESKILWINSIIENFDCSSIITQGCILAINKNSIAFAQGLRVSNIRLFQQGGFIYIQESIIELIYSEVLYIESNQIGACLMGSLSKISFKMCSFKLYNQGCIYLTSSSLYLLNNTIEREPPLAQPFSMGALVGLPMSSALLCIDCFGVDIVGSSFLGGDIECDTGGVYASDILFFKN
jgi:hypothetical protein